MYIGIDAGSVAVKGVLLDGGFGVLHEAYLRNHGQPLERTREVLEELLGRLDDRRSLLGVAVTGAGAKLIAELLDLPLVNEVVAQATATGRLYPAVRTVIEIGGEDSKLILIEPDEKTGGTRIRDFAMNALCAAGTGSFLDQQASRLGIDIEGQWGEMALKSAHPPRIAGRCSVFAKSDMIHLQQEGAPDYDIVAGLCFAMARNFKAVIGKGKDFYPTISFQGGVAANAGMVRAFNDVLKLKDGELIIPQHHASMGAIGAVMATAERDEFRPFAGLKPLEDYIATKQSQPHKCHKPLVDDKYPLTIEPDLSGLKAGQKVDAFLGVDIGSISTNVVAIDIDGRVLSRRYLMTAGRPLIAATEGLYEVGREVADKVNVCGVGTTGSGRYLIGDFIGADVVKNEITAHATAAAFVDPKVDTIFEIGGQDSKYVSLENGAVVDFTMNKVCAAGTGSFIEEQSERLGIGLKTGEFNQLALAADEPPCMGERCTVFIETDINHNQQKGVAKDDLASALCYSIAHNYLNRVVEDRRIGQHIFFQGGTAYNRGVKSAFEHITGRKITVPPHHDIMGAIGAALLARLEKQTPSRFRTFDLRDKKYDLSSFECRACSNMCEVRVVSIEGQGKLYYGSRCGKFDESKRESLGKDLPRLFVERNEMLMNSYQSVAPAKVGKGKRVGIPRVTFFWEQYPLWSAFFGELGFEVVPSEETNRTIINKGLENVGAETCYPIKVSHGHVLDCLERGVDYLFLPSIVDLPTMSEEIVNSYTCPYVQSLPYLLKAALRFEDWPQTKVLSPIFHFSRGVEELRRDMERVAADLGANLGERRHAVEAALAAQEKFYDGLATRGREVLAGLKDEPTLVIISRPYNGCDSGLNLNIPEKLRDLGCLAIPCDMLPLEDENISDSYPHMYWKYGQRILASARFVQKHPNLYPVYITNFGCGPDSFIMKFFERELKGKPCLTLEVDEHSADVGAITRCEAYLDSLKNVRDLHLSAVRKVQAGKLQYDLQSERRRLYIPYMDDHGYALAAAMRSNGLDAVQMPMADNETIELGRKVTSGKECYPCIITTGDMLRQSRQSDFDPAKSAFFMPTAYGPCRFGQYNKFQRMVLDDAGLEQVRMFTFDQDIDYQKDAKLLGPKFRKLAWSGIVFVDTMQKLARETRPYELNKGETDKVYQESLDALCRHIEKGGMPSELGGEVRRAFEAIKVDMSRPKPLIGVIGEVFVRCNPFTNNFIARKIEELGGEACLPPFEEWVNYIGWSRVEDGRIERNYKTLLSEAIVNWFQKREKNRVLRPFEGSVRKLFREASSSEVIAMGREYIHETMRGEPVLSMGRAVEYAHAGFDGVVNLYPFNCMPGTIVNGLLAKFQAEYDLPILKLAYDGLEQSTETMRLEAFMHQCHQKMEIRLGGGHSAGGPGHTAAGDAKHQAGANAPALDHAAAGRG